MTYDMGLKIDLGRAGTCQRGGVVVFQEAEIKPPAGGRVPQGSPFYLYLWSVWDWVIHLAKDQTVKAQEQIQAYVYIYYMVKSYYKSVTKG